MSHTGVGTFWRSKSGADHLYNLANFGGSQTSCASGGELAKISMFCLFVSLSVTLLNDKAYKRNFTWVQAVLYHAKFHHDQ